MIYDVDGIPLEYRIKHMIVSLDRIEDTELGLDSKLLKSFILFHKIGLGIEKFQKDILEGRIPIGYEILSSYVLDRFLSKYHRYLSGDVKALLLKGVDEYPKVLYGIRGNALKGIPEKVEFQGEAINLLENNAIRFLGFKPLCRIILEKSWDKIVFIRWYSRILEDNAVSLYSKHKDFVDSKINNLLNFMRELSVL